LSLSSEILFSSRKLYFTISIDSLNSTFWKSNATKYNSELNAYFSCYFQLFAQSFPSKVHTIFNFFKANRDFQLPPQIIPKSARI
jgi:hypothetical protein